ncbi:MAG: ATP-binding protein [Rubrivivax sp.]
MRRAPAAAPTEQATPVRHGFRPSFRQLLLAAFLLLATLLGAMALRGQFTLEQLLQKSRTSAERNLRLTGNVERLGEQSRIMERAARQFVVLRDPGLRQTYTLAAAQADGHLQSLAGDLSPVTIAAWREAKSAIGSEVEQVADTPPLAAWAALAPLRDQRLADRFRQLDALHDTLAAQVRDFSVRRNEALQLELDTGRNAVGRLLLLALTLAGVLALALATGLARPLRRVELAIDALGQNQLDNRIEIPGPSDVRQIGRRLDNLRQRLAASEDDKARVLRHVSHELKTPLAALREGVALLQDGVAGPLTDNQREVARILNDTSATLQRRIEDLLRFNAAAFAAQAPVRRETDLKALIEGLVAEQELQARAKDVAVQTGGETLQAEVDPELLASAVGNLLSNAIRYSPRGGAVQVSWVRRGDGVQISVSDQGPGVDAADRARIFEPFYRGPVQPESGGLPGTGIGLSIVAETVAAHGGTVALLDASARLAGTVGTPPAAEPAATSAATSAADPVATRGAHFLIDLPHALAD